MAGNKKWADVRAKHVRTSEDEARIAIIKQAMIDGDRLARIRQERAGTQEELAREIRLSQARISQIESGRDLYLSTLRAYIEALGGHLEIAAVFPDARIDLTPVGAQE
jgi:DNA-binding XRE family transcriptional regulator